MKKKEFEQYLRKQQPAEMRPYEPGEDMTNISVSEIDRRAGSPKEGDMIARNPVNHRDQWLVAQRYFELNFELAHQDVHQDKEIFDLPSQPGNIESEPTAKTKTKEKDKS